MDGYTILFFFKQKVECNVTQILDHRDILLVSQETTDYHPVDVAFS